MGVSILRVLRNDNIEVFDGKFVILNHLVSLGTLVDVPDFRWDFVNALGEGEDGLFKLLQVTVGKADMVVGVGKVSLVRSVQDTKFQMLDAEFVILIGVE